MGLMEDKILCYPCTNEN